MRLSTLLVPLAALGLLTACGDNAASSDSSTAVTTPGALPKPTVKLPSTTPTKLVITDLTEGTGAAAVKGDTVVVHYVGVRSADGAEFDNSYDRGRPFSVTIGAGQVIKGWDEGLVGIKTGGGSALAILAALA